MTYSVGGNTVIQANGKIAWTSISNRPTIYYGVAATSINTTSGYVMTRIETTGTNIRAVANVA